MLDIKLIRENPKLVKDKLILRNEDITGIDKILELDRNRLYLIQKTENLKEIRNKVSDEIAVMKKNKQESDDKIAEMKKVSEEIKGLDEEFKKCVNEIDILMRYIPNLPHDTVPLGKSEKDNVEIKKNGSTKKL